MKEKYNLFFLFFFFAAKVFSQSASQDVERFNFGQPDSTFSLIRQKPITIDFEEEEAEAEEDDKKEKKKKRKRKVFYGVKTKKGFTRRGYGRNVTLELFYYLKHPPKETDPYVQDIYWYDTRERKVKTSATFDPRRGYILHGPYKQLVGEDLVEQGIFYFGKKHGRWTEFNRNGTLINKRKYNKGWPKDAILKFYDREQEKLKEVIPVVYGVKSGDYYFFHENGSIAIRGAYEEDVKVGRWREYYPFLNRVKKEIVYPSDPYDKKTKPYINREWNRRGQVVYQKQVE